MPRVSDVAPAMLSMDLVEVRRHEARAAQLDEAAIHDMRVAARRLRAALQLFEVTEEVSQAVKRLQDALGSVRDLQVQAQWLRAGPLRERLESRLPAKKAQLEAELQTWRSQTAGLIARHAAGKFPKRHLDGPHYRNVMLKSLRRLKRRLKTFGDAPEPLAAHRLRIAAKQLRYQTELLAGVWPRRAKKLIDHLTVLQDEFGALHDADVRLSLIVQLAGGEARSTAVERLLKRAQADRDRRAAEAQRIADKWRHKDRVQQWMRHFSG